MHKPWAPKKEWALGSVVRVGAAIGLVSFVTSSVSGGLRYGYAGLWTEFVGVGIGSLIGGVFFAGLVASVRNWLVRTGRLV